MIQISRKHHHAIKSITVLLNVLYTRVSRTLGGCRFCLPVTFLTLGGKKKSSSIKELGSTVAQLCTSSADTAAVSAYKNSRRVWYYVGWRKTQSNRNYRGSALFSTTNYLTMVLTIFVWRVKRGR